MTPQPTPPTEEELAEIEKRANAATPGPWLRGYFGGQCYKDRIDKGHRHGHGHCDYKPTWHANEQYVSAATGDKILHPDEYEDAPPIEVIDFIAHARTDIPRLLAEVRRLREADSSLRHEMEMAKQMLDAPKNATNEEAWRRNTAAWKILFSALKGEQPR